MQSLLKADDLARTLKVSKGAVYAWVKRGLIPYLQLEKCIRFDPDEIEEWLKTRKRQGGQGNG